MTPEQLEDMPFDHYARYRLAADVVLEAAEALTIAPGRGAPALHVLDVGGGPGSLQRFIPGHAVTSTDIRPPNAEWYQTAPDLVLADGADLPFDDGSFDVVVSLDTLEHVPPDKRRAFVSEAARVAREYVLIVCPCDTPGVADADTALLRVVRRRFGEDFETVGVLREHLQYGHPNPGAIHQVLSGAGAQVVQFGSGRIDRWLPMMLQFYELLLLDHDPAVHAVQRWYNRHLYADDLADPAYRQAFVAQVHGSRGRVRPARIEARIRARHPAHTRDDDLFKGLRTTMLQALEPVVSRQQHQLTRLRGEIDAARKHLADARDRAEDAARRAEAAESEAAAAADRLEAADAERDELRAFRDRVIAHPAYRAYRRLRPGG